MKRLAFLTFIGLWVGCSSGDGPKDSGRRLGPSIAQPGGSTAGQGSEDPSGGGDFGNSQVDPTQLPTPNEDMGDDCVVGQFCAPTQPDPDDCGSLTLEAEVEVIEHPGNVLLVFDRSASMSDAWDLEARWQAAGNAISNALMPLADKLTVGSVFFPSSDPDPTMTATCVDPTGITCIFLPGLTLEGLLAGCYVSPIEAPDQLNFQGGTEFLSALSASPHAPILPAGLTPLREGLQQAQIALEGATLDGITTVIVITDGDPNCEWDANLARQIVTDWAGQGIQTHVIGLPGVGGAGAQVLNDLAQAGGTDSYITPTDAAQLEQKLREIATETVQSGFNSCEINISPPTEVPDKLHLVVREQGEDKNVPRQLSDTSSWSITDDGALVTLEGDLCSDATGGRFEALRFEFGCVDLPPLPPQPPVE